MKKFLEILEKRWWGGVGVIIALMLGLPALMQYFGKVSISWLTITIVLNVILAITLILVAVWNTKLKRKYEDASSRIKKVTEILKRAEVTKPHRVLLPDPNYIWKLNIENALLSELYGQAHGLAITKFQDAKLASLAIIVNPYETDDRVALLFSFYSQWADRQSTYILSEVGDIHESVPSKPVENDDDRATFDEPPWLGDPNWPQFLRKSCEKVGPLSPATWSGYHLYTRAWMEPRWGISFQDGVTGKEFEFSWDGKGEPIPKEHNRGV